MNEVFIIDAKRTPIGKMGGVLRNVRPEQLASLTIQSLLQNNRISPEDVDEVILGNVVGPGGNISRLSSLTAGLPVTVPGLTIDRQCGSGLEAINMGARLIQTGATDLVLAGGVESTSLAPWKMEKPSHLYDPSGPLTYGRARFSTDEIGDPDMGIAAENVARAYNISRQDQDQYAYESHLKAVLARSEGRYEQEVVPVKLQDGTLIETDECPRSNTSIEKLSRLQPAFLENGTVTAGNACPMNDGAAIVLLASRTKSDELGLLPSIRFVDSSVAGVDPNLLGIGPVPAVRMLLKKQNLTINDIDVVEFNEAFAAQVLASLRELDIPEEIVNLGGGALALGHPYGASGAVLMTRMLHEMKKGNKNNGLVTLGVGGGMGIATLVQRCI
ncbi:thiolase family protein [Pseudalkalibacillus decolorationis]|uniref:thiolase family protein n=1 Tax=Pseudalkalibacillus decolorationis TaxID=163879 RepID=UPI00214907C6|nr:thiolase family protein [Pseudalkalibacillus decolorationis]